MNSLASTVTGRSVNEVLSLADHQEDENRRQSFFSGKINHQPIPYFNQWNTPFTYQI